MKHQYKPDDMVAEQYLSEVIRDVVDNMHVDSIHTHLFPAAAGPKLALMGWDDMLEYHYMAGVAQSDLGFHDPDERDKLLFATGSNRARIIFQHHFKNPRGVLPLSTQAVGILTTLKALEIDPNGLYDQIARAYNAATADREKFIERIMRMARVRTVIGTNTIFDKDELIWYRSRDFRTPDWYQFALRLDALMKFPDPGLLAYLKDELDCDAAAELNDKTVEALKKLLRDWIKRFNARYIAVSLEPHFRWDNSVQAQMLKEVIIPIAEETGRPMFLMIEPLRQVDKSMGLAGDASGEMPIEVIHAILAENRNVNFWVMALDWATQYRLMAAKRSQSNLMLWGIWWFLLNPTAMEQIMNLRIEMNGQGCIAGHSDSRVWDQEFYKWKLIRDVWADVLTRKIRPLYATGFRVTYRQIVDTHRAFFDLTPLNVNRRSGV